ncbi:MAG: hypothetical protein ACYDAG_13250, partial [Chloroflexota bacterium]
MVTAAPSGTLDLGFHTASSYAGKIKPLVKDAQRWLSSGQRVALVTLQSRRLVELLESPDDPADPRTDGAERETPDAGRGAPAGPRAPSTFDLGPSMPARDAGRGARDAGRGARDAGRGARDLASGLRPSTQDDLLSLPEPGTLNIVPGSLKEGWRNPDLGLVVLSDIELFGWSKPRRSVVARNS